MRIAVAGGTGTVGRHVVEAARGRGHDIVLLTRGSGVDVRSGVGIDQALADVDVVIDTINATTLSTKKAVEFFETTTRRLLAAEKRAGVAHHVALSIVGIDDTDTSYYAGKLAQERLVRASDVPHTIARTGQFHEFAEQIAAQTTVGPVTLVPKTLTRPVAAREVGAHLVDVAEGAPSDRARDLVGPRDESLADMVRRMFAHDGTRRAVIEVRFPGAYGRGLASGELRGGSGRDTARTTFDEWLRTDHTPV
ncbi:SDR family oxidoreductase [Microbacterium sp. 179-I 3D3 NHS]|uniref:SDR family oxidoreductase n=1 Tax=Microbacterium sp. 179-I 3D3 NHS TaxID=3142382 RepID=UPI0039A1E944